MAKEPSYHHGDLKSALVAAGLALLEEQGLGGLSLRAIAARAGVSHAAPAHHFGNLKGLLTALAANAFTRFAASMAREREGLGAREREGLGADAKGAAEGAGLGYLAFARKHPAAFKLMFSSERLDWEDPALIEAAQRAYSELAAIASGLSDALGLSGMDERAEMEVILWSFAHGYSHLALDGQLASPHPPNFPAFLLRLRASRPA